MHNQRSHLIYVSMLYPVIWTYLTSVESWFYCVLKLNESHVLFIMQILLRPRRSLSKMFPRISMLLDFVLVPLCTSHMMFQKVSSLCENWEGLFSKTCLALWFYSLIYDTCSVAYDTCSDVHSFVTTSVRIIVQYNHSFRHESKNTSIKHLEFD